MLVQVKNVMYCREHEPVALVTDEEQKDCPECGAAMQNIGWCETDEEDKEQKSDPADR